MTHTENTKEKILTEFKQELDDIAPEYTRETRWMKPAFDKETAQWLGYQKWYPTRELVFVCLIPVVIVPLLFALAIVLSI